ncbi:hypothetical protein HPB51_004304 [Rhipicephalus microplus]|uniref:THAP-type domain-containing protein n=1 Tax=Rhipicephalus microplus TaxID=6941 RepID=A0A9J6ELB4_RHIMP|nr:hypothetical protein HPB51_004304 [Rhipicephalus microplus]
MEQHLVFFLRTTCLAFTALHLMYETEYRFAGLSAPRRSARVALPSRHGGRKNYGGYRVKCDACCILAMEEGCAERSENSGRRKGRCYSNRCSLRLLRLKDLWARSLSLSCAVASFGCFAVVVYLATCFANQRIVSLLTMPSSRSSTCFVTGCKGGYRPSLEKLSVFKAPKNPSRRQQWAHDIQRADKELTTDSVVCERHFYESFTGRTYRHVVNGEVVEIPPDRPSLSTDAVPTVFPDALKYFTEKAPVRRNDRNICE